MIMPDNSLIPTPPPQPDKKIINATCSSYQGIFECQHTSLKRQEVGKFPKLLRWVSSQFFLDCVCQFDLPNWWSFQSLHPCWPGVWMCCTVIFPSGKNINVTEVRISLADIGNSLQYALIQPQLQAHISPSSWYLGGNLIHEVWELWFTVQTSWVLAV